VFSGKLGAVQPDHDLGANVLELALKSWHKGVNCIEILASIIADEEHLVFRLMVSLNLGWLSRADSKYSTIILVSAVVGRREYGYNCWILTLAFPSIKLVAFCLLLMRTNQSLQVFCLEKLLQNWQSKLY